MNICGPINAMSVRSRKRKAEKATILTSSPYKNMLEEKAKSKSKSDKIAASKELHWPTPKRIKKSKSENTVEIQHTQSTGKNKQKKAKTNEVWFCCVCKMEKKRDMRQCMTCSAWMHDECIGVTKKDKMAYPCKDCMP